MNIVCLHRSSMSEITLSLFCLLEWIISLHFPHNMCFAPHDNIVLASLAVICACCLWIDKTLTSNFAIRSVPYPESKYALRQYFNLNLKSALKFRLRLWHPSWSSLALFLIFLNSVWHSLCLLLSTFFVDSFEINQDRLHSKRDGIPNQVSGSLLWISSSLLLNTCYALRFIG